MNKALDLLDLKVTREEYYDLTEELLAQPEQELIDLDKVDKHLEICDKSEDDYINEESGYNRSDWWE